MPIELERSRKLDISLFVIFMKALQLALSRLQLNAAGHRRAIFSSERGTFCLIYLPGGTWDSNRLENRRVGKSERYPRGHMAACHTPSAIRPNIFNRLPRVLIFAVPGSRYSWYYNEFLNVSSGFSKSAFICSSFLRHACH